MRVVAVSAESSLAAALNMMDGWEVVFAREGDDVGTIAAGATVILAGGGTEHGLGVINELRARGVDVPAVVLGDGPPLEETESTVLWPPFTLDELRSAVETAVRNGAAAVGTFDTAAGARSEPDADAPASPGAIPEIPEPSTYASEQHVPPHAEGNGSLGHGSAVREASVPNGDAADIEEIAALEPSVEAEPPIKVEQAIAPQVEEPSVPIAQTPPPVAPPAPQQPVDTQDRRHRKRWRGRDDSPQAVAPPPALPSGSVDSRLRLAEQAARAIEEVLGEMPFLADLEELSQAVVGEIVETFSPQIVSLYLLAEQHYWVAGGHQLTPAERRLNVKPDHPLFRELLATGEPMLIAPLDLARAMVSGVAGARTEAMIAGPILGSAGCIGVIVVGRDDFQDKDLDLLARLSGEAASGLGVALALDRLRSRRR